ncbi:RNA polymerase recycling motor ATPase HelR [Demequina subtropica]|uniref:RNA polymerase recycling motor ATPase HelR n=1 Tax=Demequina subtropica TaxID=1638989 RepID=UPI000780E58C|nr:RNA polymerase recycling motor ATPase HelR [Demequina subtropica]
MPADAAAFALADPTHPKSAPALIAADPRHLARVHEALAARIATLDARLRDELRTHADAGQGAVERDQRIRHLESRLRMLRRYDVAACLGRMVATDGTVTYIGRFGLTDAGGERLLHDWRTPAAEPFCAATGVHRMGLASRRRYRWDGPRIVDYWDEPLGEDPAAHVGSLDPDAAFLASLSASRSTRMRDVLATIQADQDAIIRADSRGALVVDGGPGTGKTVAALHRAAYLNHSDARISAQGGGVLMVGPHRPYLDYVVDVLPSLGEDSVHACTMRDLVPEGREALAEPDAEVARLKASLVPAIEPAVAMYEEAPTASLRIELGETGVTVGADDWAEAFAAPDTGTPHNDGRDAAWEALLDAIVDKVVDEEREEEDFDAYGIATDDARARARRIVAKDAGLARAFGRAWPTLDARDVVRDLWEVPAYLRRCAPWLSAEEVRTLRRDPDAPWSVADLPLLDAARARLGDPDRARRRRAREAADAARREEVSGLVADLIETDESDLKVMSMLRGQDLRHVLDSDHVPEQAEAPFAGPYAHVIVDEAQELTEAEWASLLRRCPSGSLTVVGDRAQARDGFPEAWEERLARVGVTEVRVSRLTVNYRTPAEVMEAAAPVIRAALPDANVPTSIRRGGIPVGIGAVGDLEAVLDEWLGSHPEGTACVIGAPAPERARVRGLTPVTAKGLEFDLVVLVSPEALGSGVRGAVDRYVAMTRATERLVVLGA